MKIIKRQDAKTDTGHKPKRECLLRQVNSVSNSESPSFERRGLAWEASTLPLSYTRSADLYYALKSIWCQDRQHGNRE